MTKFKEALATLIRLIRSGPFGTTSPIPKRYQTDEHTRQAAGVDE